MKRIAALILLAAMILTLNPAVIADTWYSSTYCPYCGCTRQFYYNSSEGYTDYSDYHYFGRFDYAQCLSCGNFLYDNSYNYYAEDHDYWNGVCELCGHVGSSNPVGGYTRKLFVCSDSVRVRSQPGGGTQYTTADYGDMFEYVRTVEYGNDGDPWIEMKHCNGWCFVPDRYVRVY